MRSVRAPSLAQPRAVTLAPRAPRSCLRQTVLGCRLLLQHASLAVSCALSRARSAVPRAAATDVAVPEAEGLWLLVGLGNPGAKYEKTRHNVGFLALDALARAEGISVASTQMRGLVGRGVVAGKQVLLVKPQTFMNLSGEAVVPLLKFYKVPPARLLVVYDDLDIDVAALRLRKKGGHGGHNGMRSIITCLGGSQDFPRLRIGIGRPQGQREVADHVLTVFDKREAQEVEVTVAQSVDVIRSVLTLGIDRAMSLHNGGGDALPKAPKAPRPAAVAAPDR